MSIVNIPQIRLGSALLAGSLILTVAACGDDSQDAGSLDSVPTPTTATPTTATPTVPGTTAPVAVPIEHPVGADDVVLRIGYEGGFVPVDVIFQNLPTLLVTGDGRLIVVGPVAEIYPGPLLPNLQVRTISEAGVQQLLAMAADHGLLTQREYGNPTNIADAPDTVVTISANGETYEHRAYALGIDTETDELRSALADFVAEATGDWLYSDNPELGAEEPYVPEQFLIRATPVTDLSVYEIEPTIVPWAEDIARLTDAVECLALPADVGTQLFSDATQLTFFQEGDTVYQVTPKQLLPGDAC